MLIDYYKLSSQNIPIFFIDSMPGYERLLDRLFNVNNREEELLLGFDCMLLFCFLNYSIK